MINYSKKKLHLYLLANSSGHFTKLLDPFLTKKLLDPWAAKAQFWKILIDFSDCCFCLTLLSLSSKTFFLLPGLVKSEVPKGFLFMCRRLGPSVNHWTVRTEKQQKNTSILPSASRRPPCRPVQFFVQRFGRFRKSFGKNRSALYGLVSRFRSFLLGREHCGINKWDTRKKREMGMQFSGESCFAIRQRQIMKVKTRYRKKIKK